MKKINLFGKAHYILSEKDIRRLNRIAIDLELLSSNVDEADELMKPLDKKLVKMTTYYDCLDIRGMLRLD